MDLSGQVIKTYGPQLALRRSAGSVSSPVIRSHQPTFTVLRRQTGAGERDSTLLSHLRTASAGCEVAASQTLAASKPASAESALAVCGQWGL
jgi:hypothetical protein